MKTLHRLLCWLRLIRRPENPAADPADLFYCDPAVAKQLSGMQPGENRIATGWLYPNMRAKHGPQDPDWEEWLAKRIEENAKAISNKPDAQP
jgi:hypothetical protein